MNDIQPLPGAGRVFPPAPSMLSVRPELSSAVADREFVFDGGPVWAAERALDIAARNGVEQLVPAERLGLQAAMRPPSQDWLVDRLSILWTQFMVARQADPRALAVWMAETGSLLGDLPHDIVAHAIDQAVRKSRHGFIPSVGEIRQFADPLVEERERQIERLTAMETAMADPVATAARMERRAATAAAQEGRRA